MNRSKTNNTFNLEDHSENFPTSRRSYMQEVQDEIEDESDRVAGKNMNEGGPRIYDNDKMNEMKKKLPDKKNIFSALGIKKPPIP